MSKMQCKVCRRFFDPNMTKTCPHCNKSNTDSDSRQDNNMPYMQDVYDPDPTPSDDSYSGGGGSFGGGG